MFTLIYKGEEYQSYLKQLVETIRKTRDHAQALAGENKIISLRLIHTVNFGKEITSYGIMRYNSSDVVNGEVCHSDSCTTDLVEGSNYSFEPVTELVTAIVTELNTLHSRAIMMEQVITSDELSEHASSLLHKYSLENGIEDGYGISVIFAAGDVSQVIVTVG